MRIQRPACGSTRWHRSRPHVRIGGVRRHKGLCLRGDRGKDTLLLEPLAVGAATIFGGVEARTSDLLHTSASIPSFIVYVSLFLSDLGKRGEGAFCLSPLMFLFGPHLTPSAVSTGNRRALSRSWLRRILHVRWRGSRVRWIGVHVFRHPIHVRMGPRMLGRRQGGHVARGGRRAPVPWRRWWTLEIFNNRPSAL